MRGKIFFNDLVDMYEKLGKDIDKRPYGLICSEETADSLLKHFEDISGKPIPSLATVSGIKVTAIKDYPFDDTIWMLDRENFEEVAKNGIESLIRKVAKANNIKFWGVDDYPRRVVLG